MDEPQKPQKTRLKFAAMAAAYSAGNLNDNFFKQSALILAVVSGRSYLQGYATIVFTLPFILFAAYAGFCADRFPKRSMIITAKAIEFAVMLLVAFAVYSLSWSLMMFSLGLLGLQATLFGPSLNGSIPELYPPYYVPTANAVIRTTVTGSILAGIAAAGFVLDIKGSVGAVPVSRVIVACVVIVVSVIGLAVSFGVPKFPAADPDARFPWAGPLNSLRTLSSLRSDSLLAVSVVSSAFFWFIASLQILIVNQLGLSQFGMSAAMTSMLILIELGGIAGGSLLSVLLAKGHKWYRVLVSASSVMAVCMFLIAFVPHLPAILRKPVIITSLAFLGMSGGVFLIPIASFIQIRPAPDIKGRVIAASSFADFCGISISGVILTVFNNYAIKPSNCFGLMGVMVTMVAIWLFFVLPKESANA